MREENKKKLNLSQKGDRDGLKKVSETLCKNFPRKVSETSKNGPVPLHKCLKRDELVSAGLGRPPARGPSRRLKKIFPVSDTFPPKILSKKVKFKFTLHLLLFIQFPNRMCALTIAGFANLCGDSARLGREKLQQWLHFR